MLQKIGLIQIHPVTMVALSPIADIASAPYLKEAKNEIGHSNEVIADLADQALINSAKHEGLRSESLSLSGTSRH